MGPGKKDSQDLNLFNLISDFIRKVGSRYIKRSLFMPIFISFICISLLIYLVIAFSYFPNVKTLKRILEEYNMQIAQEIKRTIDDRIGVAIQKMQEVCYDSRVLKYATKREYSEPSAILEALDVINYCNYSCVTSNQIKEIFIYFNNTDIILNRKTYYFPKEYYENNMKDFELSYREWISLLHSYKNFDYLIAPTANKDILILKSIILTGRTDIAGRVGIRISSEGIINIIDDFSSNNLTSIYIMNNPNRIVIHSQNAINKDITFSNDIYTKHVGIFYDKINNVNSLVTFIKSSYANWSYILITPIDISMRYINNIRNMTIGLSIFCLLFTIVLILYVITKSYNPVKKLILSIKSKNYFGEGIEKDEIQIISDVIERLYREREEIKRTMAEQYPIIRNNMLISLLKGYETSDNIDNIYEKLAEMDINFEYEDFVVLCIDIEESAEYRIVNLNGERVLVKTILRNIAQDIFRVEGKIYLVELNWDEIVMIVNLNRKSDEVYEQIYKYSQDLVSHLKKFFSIIVTIGISNCGKGIDSVNGLYEEAKQALMYKFLTGINTVNKFRNLEYSTQNYFYPVYMEKKLINNVIAGNEESALEIITTIFSKNFEGSNPPLKYSKCLCFDIISTILKLLNEMKIDFIDVMGRHFDAEKELLDCETIDEMRDMICNIIERICDYVNNKTRSANNRLIAEIIDYINNNYCKESICIDSIAEAVNITTHYLSHYFKEKMGIPVMKYIEELRVAKIKQLLRDTDMTLAEIAGSTGFSNSAVLIRTFKKYEGITPGQYKKMDVLENGIKNALN